MPAALTHLVVRLDNQQLLVYDDAHDWATPSATPRRYAISTALRGPGEQFGSGCTPRGLHIVRAKIGHRQPINSVFVGRRPTGEIYSPELAANFPHRDWILTRILWLSGCEIGKNRLGSVDTMKRYIYIHGAPDDVELGRIGSAGCIRMRNHDLVDLFDQVAVGSVVNIVETG